MHHLSRVYRFLYDLLVIVTRFLHFDLTRKPQVESSDHDKKTRHRVIVAAIYHRMMYHYNPFYRSIFDHYLSNIPSLFRVSRVQRRLNTDPMVVNNPIDLLVDIELGRLSCIDDVDNDDEPVTIPKKKKEPSPLTVLVLLVVIAIATLAAVSAPLPLPSPLRVLLQSSSTASSLNWKRNRRRDVKEVSARDGNYEKKNDASDVLLPVQPTTVQPTTVQPTTVSPTPPPPPVQLPPPPPPVQLPPPPPVQPFRVSRGTQKTDEPDLPILVHIAPASAPPTAPTIVQPIPTSQTPVPPTPEQPTAPTIVQPIPSSQTPVPPTPVQPTPTPTPTPVQSSVAALVDIIIMELIMAVAMGIAMAMAMEPALLVYNYNFGENIERHILPVVLQSPPPTPPFTPPMHAYQFQRSINCRMLPSIAEHGEQEPPTSLKNNASIAGDIEDDFAANNEYDDDDDDDDDDSNSNEDFDRQVLALQSPPPPFTPPLHAYQFQRSINCRMLPSIAEHGEQEPPTSLINNVSIAGGIEDDFAANNDYDDDDDDDDDRNSNEDFDRQVLALQSPPPPFTPPLHAYQFQRSINCRMLPSIAEHGEQEPPTSLINNASIAGDIEDDFAANNDYDDDDDDRNSNEDIDEQEPSPVSMSPPPVLPLLRRSPRLALLPRVSYVGMC